MANYDKRIDTYEIKPPIGEKIGWGAKAKLKEIGVDGDFIVLHEHFGTTEGEAAEKANAEANNWIAERS